MERNDSLIHDDDAIKYDVELLLSLNEEYEDKRLVPPTKAPMYGGDVLRKRGRDRASQLHKLFNVNGKRVLEIGCGMGETAHALASNYDCEAYGVDLEIDRSFGVTESELVSWLDERKHPNLKLSVLDVTKDDYSWLGQFDLIYSYTVWEHVMHPFSALKAVKNLLRPSGCKYLITNLYRGPLASHCYREIFFPWPHLLFQDSVIREFYQLKHPDSYTKAPPYVNKLTAAHYLNYFDILGFRVEDLKYRITPIDEDFYRRFHFLLSRYPRFDLERDFLDAIITHDSSRRYSIGMIRRKFALKKSTVRKKIASVKALRWVYDRVRGR